MNRRKFGRASKECDTIFGTKSLISSLLSPEIIMGSDKRLVPFGQFEEKMVFRFGEPFQWQGGLILIVVLLDITSTEIYDGFSWN
jgi:hypothetical protein